MKIKKLFFVFLVVLFCTISVSCSNETKDNGNKDITNLYSSTQNDDNTYSYTFADLNGNILFEKEKVVREPKINMISDDVYELITQTGTSLSTNWAVYCDVKKSKASDIYDYVLATKENYVIYAEYRNNEHFVIVQDIFDEEQYYKEYKLKNVSSDCIDNCIFDDNGNAIVTYLTGDDYTEKKFTIKIP